MKKKDYLIIAGLIILDQITKYWISYSLELHQKITVIKGFFDITYVQNIGAAWSLGEGLGWLFAILAIAISIGVIYYVNHHKVNTLEKIAAMFIVIGATGNAIDRILYGYVIDFLDFIIPVIDYDFPVFNVADIFITLSAVLLILDVIFSKEEK